MAETLVIGGAVSAFMKVLLTNLDCLVKEECRLLQSVKKEIEGLMRIVMMIQALLEDAEKRNIKEKVVAIWLKELKDIAYDAEDVLDELSMDSLRWLVEDAGDEESTKEVSSCLLSCSSFSCQAISKRSTAISLKRIKEKLDLNLDIGYKLGLRPLELTGDVQTLSWRQTSSLLEYNTVGRDEVRDQVVELLLEGSAFAEANDNDLSVIAIIGIGGLGKTTLAQLLYNDSRVKEHFELMMWVCVSHEFDVKWLTKEIIESATNVKPDGVNFNKLQEDLMKTLRGKRFLLVLDDVWNTDTSKWENLRKPLPYGGVGSKILTTTRSHEVATSMGVKERVLLRGLPDGIYQTLFERCAFGSEEEADRHPRLREIGRAICPKLGGSPLAAKTIGRLLNTNLNVAHWMQIKESELWELPQNETDILPALRLSYQHLPAHLKQCFAYCSVFPKDHKILKSSLIQMWMAHNFIHGASMEEIGILYFDDLEHRCLLEKSDIYGGEIYMMHDLIHDLARSVSMNEYFALCGNHYVQKIPTKVRHLSGAKISEVPNLNSRYKKLRSLICLGSSHHVFHQTLFLNLSSSLRVLEISWCRLERVPESIGSLIHLRYLNLSFNRFAHLPETLCKLYNLQTLKLEGCSRLLGLPKGMKKLINLRVLEVPKDSHFLIDGVGRLKCLRQLKDFRVSKKEGFRIGELKDLTELHGRLSIWNLKEVESRGEAASSELTKKPHLSDLTLAWHDEMEMRYITSSNDHITETQLEEEVLEGLQPHSNLEVLKLMGYGGVRSPSWLENGACSSLQILNLYECNKWEVLPPLGELPLLKSLQIKRLVRMRKVDIQFFGCHGNVRGFPSLETLRIIHMPDLEEWEHFDGDQQGNYWFPHLREIEIDDCPRLRAPLSFGQLSSLCTLKIWHCPKMESISQNGLPPSLLYLLIQGCDQLRMLPPFLGSLQHLRIAECPMVEAMPSLPQTLQELTVENCPSLVERCREDTGPDWSKIAHVPNKIVWANFSCSESPSPDSPPSTA